MLTTKVTHCLTLGCGSGKASQGSVFSSRRLEPLRGPAQLGTAPHIFRLGMIRSGNM